MFVNDHASSKFHLFLFFLLTLLASPSFSIELDLNATWSHDASASERSHLFRLELPAAGVATVDLTTLSGAVPTKIEHSKAPGVTVLRQSATHLSLAVRAPGVLFLRAATEDPRLYLGRYRIITGFTPARVVEEIFLFEPGVKFIRRSFYTLVASTKGEQEDVDPDPDPDSWTLASRGRLLASLITLAPASLATKGEQEDVDPDPDSAVWTHSGPVVLDQVLFYEASCQWHSGVELDDHGDTMACATPLVFGKATPGEIGNARGDDRDFFALILTELTTVEIAVRGDAETYGVLRDHSGQPLAVIHTDFTTLAPGRYFISIEGGGGVPGGYELMVKTRDTPPPCPPYPTLRKAQPRAVGHSACRHPDHP